MRQFDCCIQRNFTPCASLMCYGAILRNQRNWEIGICTLHQQRGREYTYHFDTRLRYSNQSSLNPRSGLRILKHTVLDRLYPRIVNITHN
jgi:hypothetical protein